jgi:hypothetical protein
MIGTLRKKLKETVDFLPGNILDAAARNLARTLHHDFCTRWKDGDAPVLFDPRVLRGRMQRQLGIHPIICLATCMDPRFKNLPMFQPDEKEGLWKALQDWMEKMAHLVLPQLANDPSVVPPDAATGLLPPARTPGEALQQEQDDDLYAFLEEVDNVNDSANQRTGVGAGTDGMSLSEKVKDELKRYRARPAQSVFINTMTKEYRNPLIWWKDNSLDFPIMSELARILLCIPATSAPSERIFSLASRVISKVRSSLSPENASQIVFVNGALDWFDQQTVIEIDD